MSDQTLKLEIKLNFPMFLGLSLLIHALIVLLAAPFSSLVGSERDQAPVKNHAPITVTINDNVPKVGVKNAKAEHYLHSPPSKQTRPLQSTGPKKLHLSDLMVPKNSAQTAAQSQKPAMTRPGSMPVQKTALSSIKYGADDFKKLAQDPNLQGGADIVSNERVSLNFELSKGQKEDELNESQLKLYGFLRRGAMKYVNSLYSEIKDFELQNPHLHFPLVDTKQILTGRLVYDNQGNLKQIKMVRWSNNDKLQGFFENVLKRLENLQNPPKELWVDSGEFTIFVTLQING